MRESQVTTEDVKTTEVSLQDAIQDMETSTQRLDAVVNEERQQGAEGCDEETFDVKMETSAGNDAGHSSADEQNQRWWIRHKMQLDIMRGEIPWMM